MDTIRLSVSCVATTTLGADPLMPCFGICGIGDWRSGSVQFLSVADQVIVLEETILLP